MTLSDLPNYLLLPQGESETGILLDLAAASDQQTNCVVFIPYLNPQQSSIGPKYYPITSKKEFKLPKENLTTEPHKIQLKSKLNKSEYIQNVWSLKQHIEDGNVYEINYCISFTAENVKIDPLVVFSKLHRLSKAPYAQLLKVGSDYMICASPELFLKKEGNTLATKPIKGTIKRGVTKQEDELLKEKLHNDHKERTENVMAVDVARNDLSIVAARGSVKVNRLYNIESFETVHQMVSTVSCDLKPGVKLHKILNATFPMASMTGAPKKSAMNLIDEFENFKRGPYSGTLGVIDEKGDFEMAVIIRSIFYNSDTKKLSIAVGSAITYLSDPEQEYEECLLKAKVLLTSLNAEIAD